MIEAERAIRQLALRLYGRSDFDDSIVSPAGLDGSLRELEVTSYNGAYGVAGHVIAINGSPPRGTFITVAYGGVIYIKSDGRPRILKDEDAEIVHLFLFKKSFELGAK